MKQVLSAIILISGVAAAAHAQVTPVGLWRNIDDKTGEAKAEIRIVEAAGALSGRIEKRLTRDAKADDKCDECTDDRKGKPVIGLTIMRNVKKGESYWEGGDILDAANGKVYRVRLSLSADNKKLDVRGYFGNPLFGRTQTWTRLE